MKRCFNLLGGMLLLLLPAVTLLGQQQSNDPLIEVNEQVKLVTPSDEYGNFILEIPLEVGERIKKETAAFTMTSRSYDLKTIQVISPSSNSVMVSGCNQRGKTADMEERDVEEKSEALNQSSIQVFPNPSNGIFHLNSTHPFQRLEVLTAGGTLVEQNRFSDRENGSVNLSALPSGTYYLRIQLSDGTYSIQPLMLQAEK